MSSTRPAVNILRLKDLWLWRITLPICVLLIGVNVSCVSGVRAALSLATLLLTFTHWAGLGTIPNRGVIGLTTGICWGGVNVAGALNVYAISKSFTLGFLALLLLIFLTILCARQDFEMIAARRQLLNNSEP